MNEVDLRNIVQEVRARLDGADLSNAHACFHDFPKGACGATCDVLATLLETRFGVLPYWVNADIGEGEDWCSHAWLEIEGFTVDITADQFGGEPVIVSKSSGWHASLAVIQRVHFPMEQRSWSEVGRTVWQFVDDLARPKSK